MGRSGLCRTFPFCLLLFVVLASIFGHMPQISTIPRKPGILSRLHHDTDTVFFKVSIKKIPDSSFLMNPVFLSACFLFNVFMWDSSIPYFISSARASICASTSSLTPPLIVTVLSAKVMFFRPSSSALIFFAAIGAHVPFSTKAIFLF